MPNKALRQYVIFVYKLVNLICALVFIKIGTILNRNKQKRRIPLQQAIKANLKRLKTFLNYSRNYLRRNNPIKLLKKEFVASLKDALSINKKRKMVQYKLKYQMHQLSQMEKLIAQNNEHVFLRGNKFNEMR